MLLGGQTGGTRITDTVYQAHFTLRHGISLNGEGETLCFGCGNDITSIPNHELGCLSASGSEVKARHNLICKSIASALNSIAGYAMREPNPFQDNNKRPDIEWHVDGRRIYLDVSVTHPLNPSVVAKAARWQLAAAAQRENEKNSKYRMLCECISSEFIPIVFETFGGYGAQCKLFMSSLKAIARRNSTLIDGQSIINDMLNQIAYHIISSLSQHLPFIISVCTVLSRRIDHCHTALITGSPIE